MFVGQQIGSRCSHSRPARANKNAREALERDEAPFEINKEHTVAVVNVKVSLQDCPAARVKVTAGVYNAIKADHRCEEITIECSCLWDDESVLGWMGRIEPMP